MRKLVRACCIASVTVSSAASAAVCNEHGAVVTTEDGVIFYLGKDCDAAREGGGTGTWFNSASFLAVFIDGKGYMVHEEVDCLPFCVSQL